MMWAMVLRFSDGLELASELLSRMITRQVLRLPNAKAYGVSAALVSLLASTSHAISIAPSADAEALANKIASTVLVPATASGVIHHTGDGPPPSDSSAAEFSSGLGAIGLEEGIVLSSGYAGDIVGAIGDHGAWVTGTIHGVPGDADLDSLAGSGRHTLDATSLEFGVVLPSSGKLSFRLVFGSEEYPNFTSSGVFDDVFSFFVFDTSNVLKGSWQIDASHFTTPLPGDSNPWNGQTGFNAFTDPLTAEVGGLAAGTYLVKLAIADTEPTDVANGDYDSAVFIEANSFAFTAAGVPEAGATSALLVLGLASIAGVRRRFLPPGR